MLGDDFLLLSGGAAAAGGVSALTFLCRSECHPPRQPVFAVSYHPRGPGSQAECPRSAGSSPCCDSPEAPSWTRPFFLLIIILFFQWPPRPSPSKLLTPLLAVTHCLSFATTAMTAANTEPVPDECSQVWWMLFGAGSHWAMAGPWLVPWCGTRTARVHDLCVDLRSHLDPTGGIPLRSHS